MLIFDEDDFEIGLNYADRHHEPMQQAEYLNREQLEQINPHIHPKFKQALYFSQLAYVRNPRLLQSLTQYLKQHPRVRFFEQCPIQQFQIIENRIQAIQSADGRLHQGEHIVTGKQIGRAHV